MKRPGLALGAAVALLWLTSGTAHADTYCVTPATGCDGAHTVASVQAALTAAATNPGADTIQLGPTTYAQDGMAYTGSDPVSIVGAGTGSTTLRRASAAASSDVLRGSGTGPVTLSHVHVHVLFISGSTSDGVRLDHGGTLDDLLIDADSGTYSPTGVTLNGTSTLTGSTINLVAGGACIQSAGNPTFVGDVLEHCSTGLNNQGAGTAVAQRLRIIDTQLGVDAGGGSTTTVEDSLITFSSGGTGLEAAPSGAATTLNARQVTVVGSGSGVGAKAFNHVGTGVTVNLNDTIIRGFTNSLVRDATASHPANIVADYVDYATATVSEPGAGPGSISSTHVYNDVDPKFANAVGGDYHLSAGSPLVDQDPTGLGLTESASDFDGNVRIINGARDLGAFERLVSPSATTGGASAITTTSATVSGVVNPGGGAGSWHFTYGGAGTPSVALAPSVTDQPVSVQLTGLSPGTTYHYSLVASNGLGSVTGADRTFTTASLSSGPAVVSGLKLSPRSFTAAKGSKLSYRLSSAATVTFRVRRLLSGVRSGKRCVARGHGRKGGKRCTRAVLLKGSFKHVSGAGLNQMHFNARLSKRRLSPGRYRLTATPAGGRGVSVGFKVVRR